MTLTTVEPNDAAGMPHQSNPDHVEVNDDDAERAIVSWNYTFQGVEFSPSSGVVSTERER